MLNRYVINGEEKILEEHDPYERSADLEPIVVKACDEDRARINGIIVRTSEDEKVLCIWVNRKINELPWIDVHQEIDRGA